jgi:hypothetical protein
VAHLLVEPARDITSRVDPWHARLKQILATDRWAGEDESVLIASDPLAKPVGAWMRTEEQKQVGERQALAARKRHRFELPSLAVQLCDLAAVTNGDAVALKLTQEVVRHRLVQIPAAVQKGDDRASASEPDRGLTGRVSPTDDGNARCAAEHPLRRPCSVENGHSLVVGEAPDFQPPVLSAGRKQDRTRGELVGSPVAS